MLSQSSLLDVLRPNKPNSKSTCFATKPTCYSRVCRFQSSDFHLHMLNPISTVHERATQSLMFSPSCWSTLASVTATLDN